MVVFLGWAERDPCSTPLLAWDSPLRHQGSNDSSSSLLLSVCFKDFVLTPLTKLMCNKFTSEGRVIRAISWITGVSRTHCWNGPTYYHKSPQIQHLRAITKLSSHHWHTSTDLTKLLISFKYLVRVFATRCQISKAGRSSRSSTKISLLTNATMSRKSLAKEHMASFGKYTYHIWWTLRLAAGGQYIRSNSNIAMQ